LGRSVDEYCSWIQSDCSWGGDIELSILSAYFKVEIQVFHGKKNLKLHYGEDKDFAQRLFLLYDGVHYDPIAETQNLNAPVQDDITLFDIKDNAKVHTLCVIIIQLSN